MLIMGIVMAILSIYENTVNVPQMAVSNSMSEKTLTTFATFIDSDNVSDDTIKCVSDHFKDRDNTILLVRSNVDVLRLQKLNIPIVYYDNNNIYRLLSDSAVDIILYGNVNDFSLIFNNNYRCNINTVNTLMHFMITANNVILLALIVSVEPIFPRRSLITCSSDTPPSPARLLRKLDGTILTSLTPLLSSLPG